MLVLLGPAWWAVAAESAAPPIWKLDASPAGPSETELRDVRMTSPTTYVRARRATIVEPLKIQAHDATIFAADWSLAVETLTIDLRHDAVEITTLRTVAHQE